MTLLLTRDDVRELLDVSSSIDAVEDAFRHHAAGATFGHGLLGTHVPGGGFHIKAAGLTGPPARYAVKLNANFPGNRGLWNLPTIQGVVLLFDATNGFPLAVIDSMEITALRTAAASAVAARYLSRVDSKVLSIIGCGAQAKSHLFALAVVREFTRVLVHDTDSTTAAEFAREFSGAASVSIEQVASAAEACAVSDVVVTCTPGAHQVLAAGDLPPGSFLAAVGADSENKREVDPNLLAQSVVVVDSLDQCAAIGELHHALAKKVMTVSDVRASLPEVVSGTQPGRLSDDETIIFDSTGMAIQDVAAAVLIYERALVAGRGGEIAFND